MTSQVYILTFFIVGALCSPTPTHSVSQGGAALPQSVPQGGAALLPSVPIPAAPPGYVLGGGSTYASVVIEVMFDLNCPDSAQAWPVLQQLRVGYSREHLAVIIHMFPLPYHRYAVLCTQGLHVVKHLAPTKIENYMQTLFAHVDDFSTTATANLSEPQILARLTPLAHQATGIPAETFSREIGNYRNDVITEWKYSARRGAAGTPWYFVNGVEVTSTSAPKLSDWKTFVDEILIQTNKAQQTKQSGEPKLKASDSPISSHILDTTLGQPGRGVDTQLSVLGTDDTWTVIDNCKTDSDGRCSYQWGEALRATEYKITFRTEAYFTQQGVKTFFPDVQIHFRAEEGAEHYHVPLLISPFSYTSYRGS